MSEIVTIIWANRYAVYVHGTPYAKKTLLPNVHKGDRFHYLIGALEPNFPVPAIPLRVTIDYEFVAIWHYGKCCTFYHDDYQTVFAY